MKRIEFFGGSFSPFTTEHLGMAKVCAADPQIDEVIILPCGWRPDKETTNDISPVHRAAMTDLSIATLPPEIRGKILVDDSDLERDHFTPNHIVQERYGRDAELWHLVGADLIEGGAQKNSYIHRVWKHGSELWEKLNWTVFVRGGYNLNPKDLPPHHKIRQTTGSGRIVASQLVRERLYNYEPIDGLVVPQVEDYIKRHGLYRGRTPSSITNKQLDNLRLLVVADPYNLDAVKASEALDPWKVSTDPNLIVVLGGDSTLLGAGRRYWRMRVPFFPVNFGDVGHNHNHVRDQLSADLLRSPVEVWSYPLLFVEMYAGENRYEQFAFNDAWVCSNSIQGEMGWLQVSVDDQVKFRKLKADGVLVATPQGSTSYARSMGAIPLPVRNQGMILVGNNVYDPPKWKQANLSHASQVEVINLGSSRNRKIYGCVDANPVGEVEKMVVRTSRFAAVELAFLPGHGPDSKFDRIQFPSQ